MLGKTNVSGKSANDPMRLTKSPIKGNNAATTMLNPKNSDLTKKRHIKLYLENMPSFNL